MNKFAFLLMLGGLWSLSGCSAATDGAGDQKEPGATEQEVSSNACHTKCNKCPPNQLCAQYCVQSGNCGNTCTVMMLCIQGYVWDDKTCSCIPDPNAGVPCGTTTCASGEYCCNSSCGICAPQGGVCTQQICATPL